MAIGVHEFSPAEAEEWAEWRKKRGTPQQRFSPEPDDAWRNFKKSYHVKVCACGTPYSYPKDMSDPKACQECRGEEGELVY
jgi:hypothetical protein